MNSRKMKLLRGKHSFKNYQELCAALEIDPAKRGSGRDKQKEEIRKEFFLTENKNGTYSIEKKTKADRAKATEIRTLTIISNLWRLQTMISSTQSEVLSPPALVGLNCLRSFWQKKTNRS